MTTLTHASASTPSFDDLFLEQYDRVYGILYRLVGTRDEAEDLAQEVFLKLHQSPPKSRENVPAWLYRVATNAGYNAIRSRRRRWSWQRWLVPDGVGQDAETVVAGLESAEKVRRALAQLPPQQGQLLLLRQMGLSYAELAAACDLNPNSVGKQLARAMDKLRTTYEDLP